MVRVVVVPKFNKNRNNLTYIFHPNFVLGGRVVRVVLRAGN